MLYVCILLIFVFFAGVAMTVGEGLWSNSINLLCILISIPTATLLGIPLGRWGLEQTGQDDQFLWFYVFAGMWGVFFAMMLILRELGNRVSRVRMRFIPQLEMVVGPLMGLAVAFMFTSYLTFTIVFGPMSAGVWNTKKMASWEKSTLGYFGIPATYVVVASQADFKTFLDSMRKKS